MKKLSSFFLSLFLFPIARAHCPLCTAGAMAAAGGAAYLGVSQAAIGVFIGAFAVSTGWWMSRLIKVKFPFKRPVFIIGSFILTIVPMLTIMQEVHPLFVFLFGDYGTLFNRTYTLNVFVIGSLIGGAIVTSTPWISSKITDLRDRTIPYQGLGLTFGLLFLFSVVMEVVF